MDTVIAIDLGLHVFDLRLHVILFYAPGFVDWYLSVFHLSL